MDRALSVCTDVTAAPAISMVNRLCGFSFASVVKIVLDATMEWSNVSGTAFDTLYEQGSRRPSPLISSYVRPFTVEQLVDLSDEVVFLVLALLVGTPASFVPCRSPQESEVVTGPAGSTIQIGFDPSIENNSNIT